MAFYTPITRVWWCHTSQRCTLEQLLGFYWRYCQVLQRKRIHAIKFQSIAVPNGLIANLYGWREGKRHDSVILAESQLLHQMQLHCNDAFVYMEMQLTICVHIYENLFRVLDLMISRKNLILQWAQLEHQLNDYLVM